MDYEKIFLDWKTRRTFENEMPESSADSKNDTTNKKEAAGFRLDGSVIDNNFA